MNIKILFPNLYKKVFNKPINASIIRYSPVKKVLDNIKEDNPNLNLSSLILCWRFDEDYGDEWISLGLYNKNNFLTGDEIDYLDDYYFISSDGADIFTIDQINNNIYFLIYDKIIFNVKDEKEFIQKVLNENMYDIFGFSKEEWEEFLY